MKGFAKRIALTSLVFVTALLTVGSTAAFAQDTERPDVREPDRIGRRWPRPPMRQEYLGTTGLVSKTRIERHEIYVGFHRGQFMSLSFIARDGGIDIRNAWIIFDRGRMRVRPIVVDEGRQLYLDLRSWEYIDRIILDVRSADTFGSKGQLEVYGRR